MAKKRISRKELVKEPDEFITFTGQAIRWARENTRPLMYGVCIFFGIIVLVSAYRLFSGYRQENGAALLSQTRSAYQAAVQADKDPAKVLATVKPQFERLIDEYGNWPAGRLGRVLYAHAALAGQAPDEAIVLYKRALDDFNTDPALTNSILNGLATAYIQKGDGAAAISHLERLVAGGGKALKDAALFQLGTLYKAAGQAEKSQQAYKQLSTDYPDSIYANIAKEKVAG
ncbi:MAG: tetratricopeptide repeat protein [Desulfobacterales bacterium]|nr:tetratricopeptide repeat protein [Desulfobacterales bacterium]